MAGFRRNDDENTNGELRWSAHRAPRVAKGPAMKQKVQANGQAE